MRRRRRDGVERELRLAELEPRELLRGQGRLGQALLLGLVARDDHQHHLQRGLHLRRRRHRGQGGRALGEAPGGSSYALSQTDTSPASATFSYTASAGIGAYSFYTRARDNAGNYEAAPGVADTTTSLTAPDTLKPVSSASSPAATKTSPFTVTYAAVDPSGIDEVELWVRRSGQSTYSLVSTDSDPSTPSFSYTPNGSPLQGSYRFYTRARDNAGNYEDAPATPPDSTTVYDTTAPGSDANSPSFAGASPFTVTYSASDSLSGVAEVDLYVRRPSDSGFSLVATDSDPSSASFSYTPDGGVGTYRFYTRARDAADNAESAPGGTSGDTDTVVETTKPTSSASVPTTVNDSPFEVDYTASDPSSGSGVEEVELWVKRPGDAVFSLNQTDSSPSSSDFDYSPDAGNGTYRFYTRARDEVGNYEDAPATEDDSTVFTKRPRATTVAGVNGGATPGKLENGDKLVITFDEAIDQTSIRSTWTVPATAQSVTVLGNSQGGSNEDNDDLTVSGVNVGPVELEGDYLSADANFTSSSMTINAARTQLTITLATVSNARPTAVTARNMQYFPDSDIKGATGVFIENFDPVETDADVDF